MNQSIFSFVMLEATLSNCHCHFRLLCPRMPNNLKLLILKAIYISKTKIKIKVLCFISICFKFIYTEPVIKSTGIMADLARTNVLFLDTDTKIIGKRETF